VTGAGTQGATGTGTQGTTGAQGTTGNQGTSGTSGSQSNITVTAASTPVLNALGVSGFQLTLTGNNTSSTFTNGTAGSTYTFKIIQGSGAYIFTWPSTFNGGIILSDTALLSGEVITQSFYFDGTNGWAVTPGMVYP
jgi:hypothetical protein